MSEKYACCFCGKTIEPVSPDVGSLLYTTNRDKSQDLQYDQEMFCHASCLESRLHPTAKLYVLSLLSKEPLDPEEVAKLPEFLRQEPGRTKS